MRCCRCKSTKIVKAGWLKWWCAGKRKKRQRYMCQNCGRVMAKPLK